MVRRLQATVKCNLFTLYIYLSVPFYSKFTLNSDMDRYITRCCNDIDVEFCSFTKTQISFKFTSVKLYNKLSQ